MFPNFGAFAAERVTYLLDTSKKSAITNAGFTADSKKVNTTKYSAKWETDDTKEFYIKEFPKDISDHSVINFSLLVDSTSAESATLMLFIGSENPSTDGLDYYSKVLTVEPGKWQTYQFNYSELTLNRTPVGFNEITEIRLTATGWGNKVSDGTVVYVENMFLSGEPTTITGTAPTPPPPTEVSFKEDDPVGEKIHYNSGGYETKGMRPGGNQKTNKFEIASDKENNHYLLCETLDAASDYHWDLELGEPTRYMVFEFDVTTSSSFPTGNIQYKDADNKAAGILLKYEGNTITSESGKSVIVKKGKWTNIAIVCDFLKNTLDLYVDGEKKEEGYRFSQAPSISMLRFYFNAGNSIGSNMMIDNYKVYEGVEPREVEDVAVLNQTSKIIMNNINAQSQLRGVVALSVGGNGIHYDDKKHALDAAAYVEDGRTLIPVRAVSEAFGLKVDWDEKTQTVTIDGKSKIVIDSTEMILPDGSKFTLDVPARTTNDRTFIPLRALCEQILGKTVTWNDRGIIIISDQAFSITDANADVINNYLLYDRPTKEQIRELFDTYNQDTHPRVMINQEIYDRVVYNYANDADVKQWGDQVIAEADTLLLRAMPTYDIPDGYRLLSTCRDVYQRTQRLAMAYILTKDAKYAEGLYDIFEAAGNFPDWNPQHFLDVAEMTCAFAIGYDWLYDYWSDEQKKFLAEKIYEYGLVPANDAYYGALGSYGWWTPGNETNWNVVCNGGTLMGAVAIFEQYPDMCSDMIAMQVRDVEAMMNSFYPDGAWFEGIVYWEYTMAYTVNMLSTLEACFGTDFNLSKTPGLSNSIFYNIAGDGGAGLNNFHDSTTTHETTNTYFWLSNKYNLPGVTNVRLNQFAKGKFSPTAYDILWYDTSIKGTDFYLPKDTYLRGVEFVAMRNSWTDDNGAWLSYHGGAAEVNHSHLDTGTFVFDLGGVRWAQDLGGDNYNMPGYFGAQKHTYYRLRPEGHNVYVIDPDSKEGQTLGHFAEVETLVSKERGAYSVLDMTPAYATWVNKARRGYMLSDDRRSGIVRDEIEFNQEGREFIWFMHTPMNAEIKIADKNTAYLTSEGVTLKFMIDSDIEGYEFGVMDAKPLDTSPNYSGQNPNAGIRKLYLKGTAGKENYVECKMILADDPCAELSLPHTKLDEWTIPDGTLQELPVLDMIIEDGGDIADFDPQKTVYERSIRFDDTSAPAITARAAQGLVVEVTNGETYADPVQIKVSYADNPGLYRVYSYNTTVLPELKDVGDYKRMQVIGHTASDEPEASHPAAKVSDNDIDPESRWAAENDAWIILDMGREETIDAVGISAWKGSERSYTFKIEVSADGETWNEVIAQRGTDKVNGESIGIYDFSNGAVKARYVKYSGRGNSVNTWNSLTEIAALKRK